ncbi:MAG: ATP-binding protein [Anaerolineae bacterium]|nr:ATP-binding protein [Candidatus Roseilinea sp.]MDW8449169.1 ATP-binding protein [Anaerolineae bacterium]
MAARDWTFREEVSDLRAEVMAIGVLAPALILSWGTAFVILFISFRQLEWSHVGFALFPLALGLTCILLKRPTTLRLSRWVCAVGLVAWAIFLLTSVRQPSALVWLALACTVSLFVAGAAAGWASTCAANAALIWLARTGEVAWLSESQALLAGLAIGCSVWLAHSVSRVLLRTLSWMQQGYAEAREQAQRLSERSAELALALKSLQQTTFALEQANEQLHIAMQYAEDARRSKQQFAANISHELRTPLNLIIGFSEVLLHAPSTYKVRNIPAGMLSDINIIHRNAKHLLNLVNDILDLSQIDVNHMTIVREPVQLRDFIESALEDFRQLIRERGLTLTLEIDPDLPVVYADQTRIRQVLLNLVANALRFTQRGGITIRAELHEPHRERAGDSPHPTNASSPEVVISVADTGIGIAPQDLQRIFEPFTQLAGTSGRPQGGTGLGLTISKEFVELHGGRMWVTSRVGVGSTFSFSLPLHLPAPEAMTVATRRSIQRHAIGVLAVIEPRSILARILEHRIEGMAIARAPSLADLAKQRLESSPEAIIVNQPLAPQALMDAVAQLPPEWRRAPIFQCFVPGPEDYLQNPQVCCYVVKPVTQDQFNEAVQRMLERRTQVDGNHLNGGRSRVARILLVEDDEDALRLLGRMLRAVPASLIRPFGFDALLPVEVRSGEQALEALRSADGMSLAGLILDLGLGTVNGWDVLRAMQNDAWARCLPVCILSGQQMQNDPLASAHLTLIKPGGLTARELVQGIGALLPIASPGLPTPVERATEPAATSLATSPAAPQL